LYYQLEKQIRLMEQVEEQSILLGYLLEHNLLLLEYIQKLHLLHLKQNIFHHHRLV
jgi:hypothetical protein